MKKTITIWLAAILAVCLAACGSAENEAELNLEPLTPVMAEETAAALQDTASPGDAEQETEASETDAAEPVDTAMLEAAQACIGQPVEALYAAVGEPASAQYGASCLEENAEDGMLTYDGFSVWTVRTETEEIVHAVYPAD